MYTARSAWPPGSSSHEAALGEQNAARIPTHYAPDAVVIVNGDTYRGPAEITQMYARLTHDLPEPKWRTHVLVIHDDLAYVEWSCKSARSEVRWGTDTFVVADGHIARQTASFAIVAID